jgi:hypothetical protein
MTPTIQPVPAKGSSLRWGEEMAIGKEGLTSDRERCDTCSEFTSQHSGIDRAVPALVRDERSLKPVLTDRLERILASAIEIVLREAAAAYIPVLETKVWGYVDPEIRSFKEAVITQLVNLDAEEALNYWDRLGAALTDWKARLSDELRTLANERIAVEVKWPVENL